VGVSDPRCDQCGKQPATIRYTEIDDGKVTRRKFCQACAVGRGLLEEPSKPVVLLQEMLAAAPAPEGAEAQGSAAEPVCSGCGISFRGFQQSGRLGCTTCYTAFRARLVPLLRKLHGSVRHNGKAPRAFAHKSELRQRVEDLRAELDRAVRGEDYERAAKLRDELRAVEHEQSVAARRPGPGGREPGGGS
jgi:protein arginine kinase activator